MLSTVTTIIPIAIESRIEPGDSKSATNVIASSTIPAKFAVRPAVLAAIDAACLGRMALGETRSEARDDQQRVVDPERQPEHRRGAERHRIEVDER